MLKKEIEAGEKFDEVIAIGPLVMMKFVCKLTEQYNIPTTVSMNPVMIDGTGMCGGCRVIVGGETKFACVDGPDFDGDLVDFDEAISLMSVGAYGFTFSTGRGGKFSVELDHIERLALGDADAAALADGEMDDAVVSAEHAPVDMNDVAGVGGLRLQL